MNDYGGTLNDMRLSNIKTATQGSTGSIFYLNSCMDTINIQTAVTDSRDAQTQPEGQHTLHFTRRWKC